MKPTSVLSVQARNMKTSRIGRRSFLGTTAGAAIAVGSTCFAQEGAASGPVTRTKGPIVWMGMDQKQLDDAYDQNVYAPNAQQVQTRMRNRSATMPQRLGAPRRFAYGPTQIEGLNVYVTDRPNAPVNVFVHGGAWRGSSAQEVAFLAETFVRAGAHAVLLDFIDVVQANGSLMTMADQVRRAVAWVYRNARTFGGDSNRIYVSGHSSGGHLTGVLLTTDWHKDFAVPADIIKGGLCACGIFDLKAPRLSNRSEYVRFTDEMEDSLSPQRHLNLLTAPVTLLHGTLETPEFQRQSRDFAAAAKAAGKPVELIVCEGYNHFEMIETMGNPYGFVGRAALALMKVGKP
jgi:arylformamidase